MHSKRWQAGLIGFAIMVMSGLPLSLGAQNTSAALASRTLSDPVVSDPVFKGFNAYESFSGVVSRSGTLLKLDSSLGYDFNRNFGLFAGVPFYFTSGPTSSSSQAVQSSGIGDAYIGAEVYTFSKFFRYSSGVTVGIPTGNVAKGFSSGQVTADWANHFRHSFGKLTPTISAGIGNTLGVAIGGVPTSELINGSIATAGTFVHMEEGADFDLSRRVYIGGEGYQIIPVTNPPSDSGFQAGNGATLNDIVRENGFDTWVGYQPNSIFYTEVGYSRSTTFALNSFSFRVGWNVGRMAHRNTARK